LLTQQQIAGQTVWRHAYKKAGRPKERPAGFSRHETDIEGDLSLGRCALFDFVLLFETVDAALGVEHLVLAREERVAVRAHFD
jgi:hypothetical protein